MIVSRAVGKAAAEGIRDETGAAQNTPEKVGGNNVDLWDTMALNIDLAALVADVADLESFWSRTGTTIEPQTANDNLDMGTGSISGGDATFLGDLNIEKSSGDTTVIIENTGAGANVYQTFNSSNTTTDAYTIGVQKSTDKFFISDGTSLTATPRITIIPSGFVGIGNANPTSTFHSGGSFSSSYVAKTSAYTFTVNDHHVEQQTSGVTDTLPTTTGIAGRVYIYSNVAGDSTTLQTTGGETIYTTDGTVTSINVLNGQSYTLQARPSGGWKII
ncbi:MAG: hypothetical protein GY756_26890 [bacterium]|nr:hypothetical protein [bacterium]